MEFPHEAEEKNRGASKQKEADAVQILEPNEGLSKEADEANSTPKKMSMRPPTIDTTVGLMQGGRRRPFFPQ